MSAEVLNSQVEQPKVLKPNGLRAQINGVFLNIANAVLRPIDARIAKADADWRRRAHILAQDGLVRELAERSNELTSSDSDAARERIFYTLVKRCVTIMTEPDPERIAPISRPSDTK